MVSVIVWLEAAKLAPQRVRASSPGFWLQAIATIIFILGVILIVACIVRIKLGMEEEERKKPLNPKVYLVILATVAYPFVIPHLGFTITTPIYIGSLYLIFEGKLSKKQVLFATLWSLGATLFFWVVFGELFGVRLP